MTEHDSFQNMTDQQLLKHYSDLMEELRNRDIVRSSNSPVADHAEKIAVERLGLIRAGKEAKGYDAIDTVGMKYQIKGRHLTRHNMSRQLSVIRNFDEHLFDYLIAVIFNDAFEVKEIWKIPYSFVKVNSKFSEHQHGHIFWARAALLSESKDVKRII